jgi:hypothetical protein
MLIATAVLPSAGAIESVPGLVPVLQGALCSPDEALNAQPVSFGMRGSGTFYSADLSCVNAAGVQRSVNDQFELLSVGAFLVPFSLGMVFVMVGAARMAKTQATLTVASEKNKVTATQNPTATRDTLVERLAALEDAYHKRQITEDEYQELRKKLLEQFTRS